MAADPGNYPGEIGREPHQLHQKIHSNEVGVSKYETTWIRWFFTSNYSFYEILGNTHLKTTNGSSIFLFSWSVKFREFRGQKSRRDQLSVVRDLDFEALVTKKNYNSNSWFGNLTGSIRPNCYGDYGWETSSWGIVCLVCLGCHWAAGGWVKVCTLVCLLLDSSVCVAERTRIYLQLFDVLWRRWGRSSERRLSGRAGWKLCLGGLA